MWLFNIVYMSQAPHPYNFSKREWHFMNSSTVFFYQMFLHGTRYLSTQRLNVPLSAPLVARIPPFSSPINLGGFLKVVEEVSQLTKTLVISGTCPLIGFGKIDSSATHLELSVPPHESLKGNLSEVNGLISVEVRIFGHFFGQADSLLAQPADSECGAQPGDSYMLQMVSGGEDESLFEGTLPAVVSTWESLKFCYCEAPGCHKIGRHCQDAGVFSWRIPSSSTNLQEFCATCILTNSEEARYFLKKHD